MLKFKLKDQNKMVGIFTSIAVLLGAIAILVGIVAVVNPKMTSKMIPVSILLGVIVVICIVCSFLLNKKQKQNLDTSKDDTRGFYLFKDKICFIGAIECEVLKRYKTEILKETLSIKYFNGIINLDQIKKIVVNKKYSRMEYDTPDFKLVLALNYYSAAPIIFAEKIARYALACGNNIEIEDENLKKKFKASEIDNNILSFTLDASNGIEPAPMEYSEEEGYEIINKVIEEIKEKKEKEKAINAN